MGAAVPEALRKHHSLQEPAGPRAQRSLLTGLEATEHNPKWGEAILLSTRLSQETCLCIPNVPYSPLGLLSERELVNVMITRT